MKSVFVSLALLITSHSAMAAHVYFDDDCTAYTLDGSKIEISIQNSRPTNPHVLDIDMGNSDKIPYVTFVGGEKYDDDIIEPVLVLKQLSSKTTAKKTLNEEGYEGDSELSVRVVKVVAVDPIVKARKDLKAGQTLTFVCRTTFLAPNGK